MAHSDPVLEARRRINEGERLPKQNEGSRPYFCRGCSQEVLGYAVPRGWYILTRSPGSGNRASRLGLFCSARCLAMYQSRLQGIEGDLGETWDTAPSPYRS
jgi:hypothetical protein